jgi:hypothetical protein
MASQSMKRAALKKAYWPNAQPFTTPAKGFFQPPRTLPYLLTLLNHKKVSGNTDPVSTYVELLARHVDYGIVEVQNEADHAFAAGHTGERALRTWRERIRQLEEIGFIMTKGSGNQKYRYIFLVDPAVVIAKLETKGLVSAEWKAAYYGRGLDCGAVPAEDSEKVVSISRAKKKSAR